MGNDGKDSNEGIIPCAVQEIFQRCEILRQEGCQTKLTMAYLEIYKEECYDLLSTTRVKCDIREGTKGDTYVEGLTQQEVSSAGDVFRLLSDVSKLRATAKTAMNSQSSRSHAICTFSLKTIRTQLEDGISTTITTNSSLNLVDLAGSERAKKTHASGDVFAEGVNINKGLLALGNVIVALSSGGSSVHVPYRDSKITRILKDSLGGNSMTVMIACVSPADSNFEETLNTLRFSSRVSCVVNNITLNKEYSGLDSEGGAGNQQLLQEICHLREQLQLLQPKGGGISSTLQLREQESGSCSSLSIENVMPLITFIKNILIKCLEDDVLIDKEILESATRTLQQIKETVVSSTESIEEGFDFLPPIMKLIESFEELERWGQQQLQLRALIDEDLTQLTSSPIERKTPFALLTNDSSVHEQEGEDEVEEAENTELMSSREREVEDMMRLATQVSSLAISLTLTLTNRSIFVSTKKISPS
jgi:hypothetical protein